MKNTIKPIRTTADYEAAQRRAAALLLSDPALGSPQSDELDVLGTLIAAYDREHFPVGPADPIAAIEFAMDQRGLEPKDLVPFLGTRSRATEVLQGKRGLSLEQISRLHHGLGIPLACLIPSAPPRVERSTNAARTTDRRRRTTRPAPTTAQRRVGRVVRSVK
jgi:HTH-type transcriptional regulator/antitoxin HigA